LLHRILGWILARRQKSALRLDKIVDFILKESPQSALS